MSDVPAGVRTLTVRRLGYADASETVTVVEGSGVNLDFSLTPAAVRLTGIVATATGEQQKRSIGNVIGSVAVDSIVSVAPITHVTDLLQGRVAGVLTFSNAGVTGSAARIRVRGFNSLSQSNAPLLIIDGVRVENTTGSGSQIGRSYSYGWTAGSLTDLNPEEIESIDVVKGPSAATLYGTDAANGVILVRTKRGRPGATKWTIYTEGGLIQQASDLQTTYFAFGKTPTGAEVRCENRVRVAGGCSLDSLAVWNPMRDSDASPIGTGHRQQLGLQMSGGVERLRYFVATELENETGYLRLSDSEIARKQEERGGADIPGWQKRPNFLRRLAMRGNVSARLSETADVNISTGLTKQSTQIPGNDVFWRGSWGAGYNDAGEGWWAGVRPGDLFSRRSQSNVTRVTTGLNANWIAWPWLTLRGTVGIDHTGQFSDNLYERGHFTSNATSALGSRNHIRSTTDLYTVDLGGTSEFDVNPSLSSRTSIGVQYNRRHFGASSVTGSDLPPGARTMNGAANVSGSEQTIQSVVAGSYVEQTFDYDGRLFLTGALRADGASSFGRDFQTAWYPKGSVSWMISDEGFFPDNSMVNSLRYRFAYGASGIQPEATAALPAVVFGTVFANGASRTGARLQALGNPGLRPERVSEFETGFDVELLDGRIQLEATAYYRKSVDALVQRSMPRSIGITGTGQLDNVGSVRNMGIEGDLQTEIFSSGGTTLSFNLNGSINSNELLELAEGLRPPEDRFVKFVAGYPFYSQWDRRVESWNDANGDGMLQADEVVVGDSIVYLGNTNPTDMLNATPTLSLLDGRVTLTSLFVYRGGWIQTNFSELNKCNFGSCRARNDPDASIDEQAKYIAFTKPGLTYAGYQEDGTFVRWAEASVIYSVHPNVLQTVGLGASNATVTFSARNLMLWTRYSGPDSEVTANPSLGGNFGTRWDLGYDNPTAPPARYLILRVNLHF